MPESESSSNLPWWYWRSRPAPFMAGLASSKSLTKDMDEYERYLSVLKSVLPRSTTEEEFEELFMEELDPTMTEKRNKIHGALSGSGQPFGS